MKISFTKEQFEALMKLVYLGNWMVNAPKVEPEENDFEKLEAYIFSFANAFGFEKFVEYDEETKTHFPTREFEESGVTEYISEYEADVFWDKLALHLSGRDLLASYGAEALEKMSFEERLQKQYPLIEKYHREFEEKGIQNLGLKIGAEDKENPLETRPPASE